MKHTIQDLKDHKKLYEANFEKLLECKLGSKRHKELVRIEHKLDREDERIRKALGLFIPDPCLLTFKNRPCSECSGFYKKKKRTYTTKSGKKKTIIIKVMIPLNKTTKNAIKCGYKDAIKRCIKKAI